MRTGARTRADAGAGARAGARVSRRKAERWITFGRISVITHTLLAIAKLVMGVAFHSQYFVAGAIYAALTSAARAVSVRAFLQGRSQAGQGRRNRIAMERRAYRRSGVIIAVASVSYLLCGVLMLMLFDATMEADFGTVGGITAATVAFTELGLAVWGLVSTRGAGEPSLAALKAANLSSSFISISLAQAALVSMASDIPSRVPDALGCIAMASLSLGIGLLMVAKSKTVGS